MTFCKPTSLQNDILSIDKFTKRQFSNATIYQLLRQFVKRHDNRHFTNRTLKKEPKKFRQKIWSKKSHALIFFLIS